MNNSPYETVSLEKGAMRVYDCGGIRLHAYQTNDPIDDEVFILEKEGRAVLIESPCFFDNSRELEAYLAGRELQVSGMLLSYHMAGASFLPGVPRFATKNADVYGHSGGGRALIDQFAGTFGAAFDSAVHTVTDFIGEGPLELGGIRFVVTATPDAFDMEIPELRAVYIHMLGHDCHSIVAGPGHADALIGQLEGYLQRDFDWFLTSHYTPEDRADAQAKIAYLREMKAVAARSSGAGAFRAEMHRRYPAYSGGHYLDMTAGFFFPETVV